MALAFPNLPDFFSKFIVCFGLLGIMYTVYKEDNKAEKLENLSNQQMAYSDSIANSLFTFSSAKHVLINTAHNFSTLNNIKNPLVGNGDSLKLKWDSSYTKYKDFWDTDLNQAYFLYLRAFYKQSSDQVEYDNIKEHINFIERTRRTDTWTMFTFFLILLVGCHLWIADEKINNRIKIETYNKTLEKYPFCHSCGVIFNSMFSKGTEKDGTRCNAFCSECYANGSFTNPKIDREEFLLKAEKAIEEFPIKKGRKILKNRLDSLERWRNDSVFRSVIDEISNKI